MTLKPKKQLLLLISQLWERELYSYQLLAQEKRDHKAEALEVDLEEDLTEAEAVAEEETIDAEVEATVEVGIETKFLFRIYLTQ